MSQFFSSPLESGRFSYMMANLLFDGNVLYVQNFFLHRNSFSNNLLDSLGDVFCFIYLFIVVNLDPFDWN